MFPIYRNLFQYLCITFLSDGPIIKSVGPDKLTTATLYSSTSFACSADGNPPPKYQWLQRVSNLNGGPHETVILRSTDPKLHFTNITYDFQGKYVCLVTNMIGDSERKMESQSITLQVIGKYLSDQWELVFKMHWCVVFCTVLRILQLIYLIWMCVEDDFMFCVVSSQSWLFHLIYSVKFARLHIFVVLLWTERKISREL